MKPRIKKDKSILAAIILATLFSYLMPGLTWRGVWLDNILDFIGFAAVMKGNFIRMAARGHKKVNSAHNDVLVTTGPYAMVRNPMYLGSFLMGLGFILIALPLWFLPFFAAGFYHRFTKQILKEEQVLSDKFGEAYNSYFRKTTRFFPSIKILRKLKPQDMFDLNQAFRTKEVTNIWAWSLGAILLETLQQILVFRAFNVCETLFIFMAAATLFGLLFLTYYRRNRLFL